MGVLRSFEEPCRSETAPESLARFRPGGTLDYSMVCDDEQTLQLTGPMFDGLYEYQRRALLLNRPPA